ncbi:MAG: ATP-dependent DNA helicase [Methylococcales symbiont of Iophon sp. n. MRB-2018]|nr:MAG: ATP-dependent DNA helicase [Methylococcales symbiont of Iophon sp. n. MRB-2018]KAF3979906.1 MAG: ATP-dependent DNA helicase [Methylococcales symbiont of Iophon sp. n. MRB-2018]
MTELESFFSIDGALSKVIQGYLPRTSQLEMAIAIADSIDSKQNLIAEAGTGTGKTFAYLVPAILSAKKVIISTGTKNLQDQLFNKDLPLVRKAISIPFNSALLKGRANYLCIYRLQNALNTSFGFSKQDAQALNFIKAWSKQTKVGDISEVSDVEEGDPVWSQATSTVDNCLGQECPDYADCFLAKARKKAQESDIIVVNHYLLCADWSLRETGFGELLPDAEVVVIDEAHQLSEIASNFLGTSLTARQLNELATDTLAEYFKDAKDMPEIRTVCEDLQFEVKDLRLAFGVELQRGDWKEIEQNPKISSALTAVHQQLKKLVDHLQVASVRSKGLESCFDRVEEIEQRLDNLINDNSGQWIRWYETHSKSFTFSKTPLDIAAEFAQFMRQHKASWIFTSATLSVAKNFNHFAKGLGLNGTEGQSWESPFDFSSQSLFYHPKGLPKPTESNFTEKVVEFALPVLQASKGRAFFLFTSHRALKIAAEILQDRIDYPLLVQGTRAKAVLLEQFKQKGDAILLATSSFWEGVDVRGNTLSCVIIDKLPFSSPSDPVLKARLQAMEKQGRNPFFEHQLPSAVIALRQGVGRLIRDVNDKGVLMVCDPRLLKRAYGQMFLDSLPAMSRTRNIIEVEAFFRQIEQTAQQEQ